MNKVGRIKSVLLALLAVVGILAMASQGVMAKQDTSESNTQAVVLAEAGVPVVTIGSGDVLEGAEITVPMTVSLGTESLGAAEIEIQYDNTVLTATDCDGDPNGDLDLAQCNINFADDTVRLAVLSAAGVSGDIALANITFQAIGAEGDSSALALTVDPFTDPSGNAMTVTTEDGTVTIGLPTAVDLATFEQDASTGGPSMLMLLVGGLFFSFAGYVVYRSRTR